MPKRLLVAAAVFVWIAVPALAQTGSQNPPAIRESVEVVATKLPEAPHDVPASVEVISGDDLRARGATNLRDALALASGVSIGPGGDGGPASSVPEFWGLREFDAFLLVVDDVPWGGALNPALTTLSLQDVERVEVLRGPAPVTYGATSFVGVIHVVHKAASANTRYLNARFGSYSTGGVAVDLPIAITGAWKSRVSADIDRGGFKDDRTSFNRSHVLWRAGNAQKDRKTWFTVDFNALRQSPASPHPRQGPALSTAVPLDYNANPDGAFVDEDRLAAAFGFERAVMNGATWSTLASYTHSSNRAFRGFLTDISNSPNNANGFKENIDLNDLYADSHVVWPERSHVTLMGGADFLFANGEAKGASFAYTTPLSGSPAPIVQEPTTLPLDSEDRREFFGAYLSGEWRPSSRLTIEAGGRLNSTTERRGEGASVTFTRGSGTVGALFSLWEKGSDHARVFGNLRSTFKPAAFDFGLVENEGVLDPETSRAVEGGAKIRMMHARVDVEATAFRMNFKNLVTPTVVDNLPVLINAGTTRFQGFEIETDLRMPHAVSARAGYSFHDGKFVDFIQAFDNVPTQLGGNRFEMSARHLFSVGLIVAPPRGVIASVTANYTGDRYLNKRNTALAPAFTTIDAGAGYRMERLEIRVDGRNLGNRRDAVSESEFGDAQYYRMPARSITAGVVLKY